MPPISFHLGVALEAAPRLGGVVTQNLGSYLFGSTLPDIHLFTTTLSREETHHFELEQSNLDERGLVSKFQLSFVAEGDGGRALAAGYLSHLVTDIVWIRDIYRPLFAPGSPLGDDPQADLYDRTLQFQIDIQERQRKQLSQVTQALADFNPQAWLGVDRDTLKRWQGFVLTTVERERSWQTFPHYVREFLLPLRKVKPEQVEEFLTSLPDRIERLAGYVPQSKISALRQKAAALSLEVAMEYLGENLG